MTIPRFLVPERMSPGASVPLPAAVDHHARRVLRLRAGAALILFDGKGSEFEAVLAPLPHGSGGASAHIVRGGPVDREARLHITLVQALCAPEKIDWLVEKCVELGASRLIVAPAARSVVRLDGTRRARRNERWRDIADAACGQCGRNQLAAIEVADDLETALRAAGSAETRWLLDPAAGSGLQAGSGRSVACVIGPEGGFTALEQDLAGSLGYVRARLGPRVLRTETAGLAAIGALLALHGEYA